MRAAAPRLTRRAIVAGAVLGAGSAAARPRFPVPAVGHAGDIAGYGALSDGVADDAAAIAEAAADGPVTFRTGVTRIASGLTISSPVTILPGATLRVDGAALTIDGPLAAPLLPVFDCVNGGTVTLGPRSCLAAHAEWWGAAADGATECAAAINAALRGHGLVQLLSGTYRTLATIRLDRGGMVLRGAAQSRTVIHHESADGDIVRIAPSEGTVLDAFGGRYFSNVEVAHLSLVRTVPPRQPGAQPDESWACGMRVSRAVRVHLTNVGEVGNAIGFHIERTINVFARSCTSSRTMTAPEDRYVGWWIDGRRDPATLQISPNASSRLADCIVSTVGPGISTALLMDGFFADQFLDGFESAGTDYGIVIDGLDSDDRFKVDVTIRNAVIDAAKVSGIVVKNCLTHSMISFIGGYAAPTGSATGPLVDLSRSWNVTFGGGFHAVGWPCPTATAFRATACRQVTIDKTTKIQDCFQPVEMRDCVTSEVSPNIAATDARSAGRAAIGLTNCARIKVEARIDGTAAGHFGQGVAILDAEGGRSGFIEVNGTGINLGPVGQKISDRGRVVGGPGPFGYYNLASGIMN